MKYLRNAMLLVLGFLIGTAIPSLAMTTYTGFTTRATGYVVLASDWNNEFGNFISHYNSNVIAALNLFAAKGDLLTYTGAALAKQGVGADGTVLTADSAQANGIKWAAVASTVALTTKGDLLTYHTGALQRVPVGTDGYVLTSRSSATAGVAWESGAFPTGGIVLWSGSIASVPSGWHLCDGTGGTPNLQGLFVVGAGNVSPAATGGMGLVSPGGPSGDTSAGAGQGPAHTHSLNASDTTIGGGGTTITYLVYPTRDTGSATITPRYYALAYIQKL